MLLLSCRGIKKSFADTEVLKGIDLDIKERERIGLVGPNGCGKTTLANLIYGMIEPDEGSIQRFFAESTIGYLLQSKDYLSNHQSKDYDVLHQNKFLKTTKQLGLNKVFQWEEERLESLSGGEKTKLALAKVLVTSPQLLILDEPTNNLDYAGAEWLRDHLASYHGAILIISHDRYFLDQVVTRIVEIDDGVAQSYSGNYTFYRQEKNRQREIQLHHYYEQKKSEAQIEIEINRLRNWSAKAHREAGKVGKMAEIRKGGKEFYRTKAKKMDQQVKSRIQRLEKLKKAGVSKPTEEPDVHFLFNDSKKHGRRVLEGDGISKRFNHRILFTNSSFCILRGEKVGIFGPNGCGKTTLIKLLLGQEKLDQGTIWMSPSAKIGYLSQDISDLDPKKTILETLGLDRFRFIHSARSLLANLGFDDSKIEKKVSQLSMGERIRLKLAKLILDQADLLILDEPTNHLDLYSREELEAALLTYQGTLLLVSHDRYMIEKLCNRLLIFENQRIRKVTSGFKEYQANLENDGQEDLTKLQEELMLIENRLTVILGKFNQFTAEDLEYQKIDTQFQELLQKKKRLQTIIVSRKSK